MVILVVDDEAGMRSLIERAFNRQHSVILCSDGVSALDAMGKTAVDIVIADNQMPKMTGIELLRQGKKLYPTTSFVLMTAFGSVEQAVEAIRLGADDYLTKPFDLSELLHRVQRVEELGAWRKESALKAEAATGLSGLIGDSASLRAAKAFIGKVSQVASPVLLLGPSGSGKEVVAKAIHQTGKRATRAFIPINCATLNGQMLESELFGHERGAFTGAVSAKPGKFELASGGTIFLDEIGELSPEVQAKLLRVLQEKEYCRVGGVRHMQTDARVIAATHRPLKKMVSEGTFREDLYFRLNVLALELQPLGQRKEDVPVLLDHFLEKFSRELGRKILLSTETRNLMVSYHYPGNVREMQNAIERLAVLAPDTEPVGPEFLPAEFFAASSESGNAASPAAPGGLVQRVEELERKLVMEALEKCAFNQAKAAESLRITRGGIQYKIRKYAIQLPGAALDGDTQDEAA